jgi:hypothetical protein
MHVFSDIRPYICTFSSCKEPLWTFATRMEWADHEFKNHYSESQLSDIRSIAEGTTAETSRGGVYEAPPATNDEVIPKATTEHLSCPLCRTSLGNSKRIYISHVAKHMESIALAVLPADSGDDSDDDSSAIEDFTSSSSAKTVDHPSTSALLPTGASGPPNPFALPHPVSQPSQGSINSNIIDTRVSARPSGFMNNEGMFLPGPSSFYPEWNYREDGSNTLPSPLNFATPVEDDGEKREWIEEAHDFDTNRRSFLFSTDQGFEDRKHKEPPATVASSVTPTSTMSQHLPWQQRPQQVNARGPLFSTYYELPVQANRNPHATQSTRPAVDASSQPSFMVSQGAQLDHAKTPRVEHGQAAQAQDHASLKVQIGSQEGLRGENFDMPYTSVPAFTDPWTSSFTPSQTQNLYSLPKIYVHDSNPSDRFRHPSRSSSTNSILSPSAASGPMSIPNARDPVPPPLPPPKHLADIADGGCNGPLDLTWLTQDQSVPPIREETQLYAYKPETAPRTGPVDLVRRYKCRYCERSFNDASNLKRHERATCSHIRAKQKKPFTCSCGKSFGRSDALRFHQAQYHKDLSTHLNYESEKAKHTEFDSSQFMQRENPEMADGDFLLGNIDNDTPFGAQPVGNHGDFSWLTNAELSTEILKPPSPDRYPTYDLSYKSPLSQQAKLLNFMPEPISSPSMRFSNQNTSPPTIGEGLPPPPYDINQFTSSFKPSNLSSIDWNTELPARGEELPPMLGNPSSPYVPIYRWPNS